MKHETVEVFHICGLSRVSQHSPLYQDQRWLGRCPSLGHHRQEANHFSMPLPKGGMLARRLAVRKHQGHKKQLVCS